MIRVAVLVATLALPALCRADQIWRWEDSAGRLHYSNVRAHVPSYAEPLSGTIGTVKMQPLPQTTPMERVRPLPAPQPTSMAPHRGYHRYDARGCCGYGYPFGLVLNSTDPSELVKQASVLDALGFRWRNGCYE
jgi:hypothetical protein